MKGKAIRRMLLLWLCLETSISSSSVRIGTRGGRRRKFFLKRIHTYIHIYVCSSTASSLPAPPCAFYIHCMLVARLCVQPIRLFWTYDRMIPHQQFVQCLSVCPSVCLSVCPSIPTCCLSVRVSVRLSVRLSSNVPLFDSLQDQRSQHNMVMPCAV